MPLKLSDLDQLSDVIFTAGPLGEVKTRAYSGAFENWLPSDEPGAEVIDALGLVRSLLLAHSRRFADSVAIEAQAVTALDDDALDQIADAFIAATGEHFRPRHSSSGEGPRRRIRMRTSGEAYDIDKRDGETGSQRLLRVLCAFRQDRHDHYAMMLQSAAPAFETVAGLQSGYASATDLPASHAAIGWTGPDAVRFGRTAYHDTVMGKRALSERREPLADVFGADTAAAKAVRDAVLGGDHARRVNDVVAGVGAIGRQMWDGGASAIERLNRYPNLGLEFERRRAALEAVNTVAVGGIGGLDPFARVTGAAVTVGSLYSAVFSDQLDLARQLDRRFGALVIEPFRAALEAAERVNEAAVGRTLFPPGFQLTAAAGLHDERLGGIVAEVLGAYGKTSGGAPVFARTMATATVVDNDAFDERLIAEQLKELSELVAQAIAREPDPIVRFSLGKALNLGNMIFMAAIAWLALQATEKSATSADISRLERTIQKQGDDAIASEREKAADDRRLRYVVRRTALRADSNRDGRVIRLLYPDTMVRVVDERGPWFLVEVLNYRDETVIRGWANRATIRVRPSR